MNDITDASLSINDTTLHAMRIVRGSSEIMLFVQEVFKSKNKFHKFPFYATDFNSVNGVNNYKGT